MRSSGMPSRWGLLLRTRRAGTALVVAVVIAGVLPASVFGAINVSAATGGTAISVDTNSVDGSGLYTTLGTASVIGTLGTLKAGTITFSMSDPAKFGLLITAITPTFTGSGCGSLAFAGFVNGAAMTMNWKLNGASTGLCTFSVTGIKVRPTTAGAAGFASERIVVSCDTCGIPTPRGIGDLATVAGAPRLSFTQGPIQDAAVGEKLFPQPVVRSADQFGNVRTGDPIILLASTRVGGFAPFGCTIQPIATNAAGDAEFTSCAVQQSGDRDRLQASTGSAVAFSNVFNVYGPASKLAFTAGPKAGTAAQAFPVQPVVAVQDQFGTKVLTGPASRPTVTLSLGPGAPVGAALTCGSGNSSMALAGLAAFSGCSVNVPGTYTLVATGDTTLLPAASGSFVVTAAGAIVLTTSAPIPPGAKDSVILWGQGLTLSAQFAMPGGAGRSFTLEATRDGTAWITIATLTTDATGHATFQYRPVTNLFYRASFAGAPDLGTGMSNQVRTVVRELAVLRPTNGGATKSIARGTSITFTTTVRPARPELARAVVSFVFYRNVSGTWLLATRRDVTIDASGLAKTTFTFSTAGQWRVRSQAGPTPFNANSVLTPIEQYVVR